MLEAVANPKLFIPLGDDFRWDDPTEISDQFSNYKKIMDYVNNNPSLHAEIRFATLTEYFAAVRADVSNHK